MDFVTVKTITNTADMMVEIVCRNQLRNIVQFAPFAHGPRCNCSDPVALGQLRLLEKLEGSGSGSEAQDDNEKDIDGS